MQFLSLALKTVAHVAWAHIRTWHLLPLAFWLSIRHGGLFRFVWRTITGFRWLTKKLPKYQAKLPGDKIHFLRTGSSDAILLESNGKFALIDAAEDSAYPAEKPHLAYVGWENYVCDYVKRVANGTLDFIIGTHAHSDHIGGFDTLVTDPGVTVNRAYLKRYDNSTKEPYERDYWDNEECYTQMLDALDKRSVPVIQSFTEEPFVLGNFKCTIINGENQQHKDENANSLGLLVEHSAGRAFLAGDINNIHGAEQRLAPQIGKVDLLKPAHHGYDGSTTFALLTKLQPKAVVFTNYGIKAYPTVKTRCLCAGNSRYLFATGTHGGVCAVFGNEQIDYYAIGEFAQAQEPESY